METWFDEGRDELRAVQRRDGRTIRRFAGRSGDIAEEEAFFPFRPTSVYRDAMASGAAREVARGTLRGQPVIWLEGRPGEGLRFRVAVHAETIQPLQLQLRSGNVLVLEIAVLRLEQIPRAGTPLEQPPTGWSPFEEREIVGEEETTNASLARARRALGRVALWPGRTIAGHAFSSAWIGRATVQTSDGQRASARIVELRYGAKRLTDPLPSIDIVQGTAGELRRVWALEQELVPPAGTIDLERTSIQGAGSGVRTRWEGRLQKGGFYIRISAWSRAALLAAARALRPISTDASRGPTPDRAEVVTPMIGR